MRRYLITAICSLLGLSALLHFGVLAVDTVQMEMQDISASTLFPGQKKITVCTIRLPQGQITDVTVELLPSVGQTVLAIGNVDFTTVDTNAAAPSPTKHPSTTGCIDATGQVQYMTRFVYILGDIIANNNDATITFTYEVVLVCTEGLTDGVTYWNTCGMEYNGVNIWVAQTSVVPYSIEQQVLAVPTVFISPALQDGETRYGLPRSGTLTLTLLANIPYPVTALRITATITKGSPSIYLPRFNISSVGQAYSRSINSPIEVNGNSKCPLTSELVISFERIVNFESQETSPNANANLLEFSLDIKSIGGNDLDVAAIAFGVLTGPSLGDLTEIHVSEKEILLQLGRNDASTVSFQLTAGETTVSPQFPGYAILDLTFPMSSNFTYIIYVTTQPMIGATKALEILGVRPVSYGTNYPCHLSGDETITVIAETKDSANYTFYIANVGSSPAPEDKVTFYAVFKMSSSAVPDQVHQISVTVTTDGGTASGTQTLDFTVGDPQPFTNPVNFSFDLSPNHDSFDFVSGSSVSVNLKICTEPGTVSGPIAIELAVPSELEVGPRLTLCSAKTQTIGANVISVMPMELEQTTITCCTNTTTQNATRWSKVDIPLIANFEIDANDVEANCFIVHAVFQIEDRTDTVGSGSINHVLSIVVNYSASQLYVGDMTLHIKQVDPLSDVRIINSFTVPNAQLDLAWLEKYIFQISVDGLSFTDTKTKVSGVNNGESTILTLLDPVFTKYVRLTSARCQPIQTFVDPVADTSTVSDSVLVWGPSVKSDKLTSFLMLALDKSRTTCFSLPQPGDNTLPPVFNLKLQTEFLDLSLSAYDVKIVGIGLDCNPHHKPKLTQVKIPKGTTTGDFGGPMKLCTSHKDSGTFDGDKIICHYVCECTDISCAELIIFIGATENLNGDPFQLCELETINI